MICLVHILLENNGQTLLLKFTYSEKIVFKFRYIVYFCDNLNYSIDLQFHISFPHHLQLKFVSYCHSFYEFPIQLNHMWLLHSESKYHTLTTSLHHTHHNLPNPPNQDIHTENDLACDNYNIQLNLYLKIYLYIILTTTTSTSCSR